MLSVLGYIHGLDRELFDVWMGFVLLFLVASVIAQILWGLVRSDRFGFNILYLIICQAWMVVGVAYFGIYIAIVL